MATTPVDLFMPPRHVPGEGMARVVGHAVMHVKSNVFDHSNLAVGANALFNIPADTYIHDLRVLITEAFDGSMTGILGDGVDDDRFMDDTALAPASTGWKSMLEDAQPGSHGYVYESADTLDFTRGGGTPSAGSAEAHLFYVPRASENGFVS